MIDFSIQRYAFLALASAALFGISTPLAKLLLDDLPVANASPVLLAGLLYLGGGLGLGIAWMARAVFSRVALSRPANAGSSLRRGDLPWLAGSVLCGGILAPVLLLWGLAGMTAASAALLLNAEAVLTALVAALLFGEAVGRRVWIASFVMLAAGIVLAWQPGAGVPVALHAGAVLAACLLWGMDNNLTRNIAASDALTLAMVKCLAAGTVNFALGGWASAAAGWNIVAAGWNMAAALTLGAASYGASLVLYVIALRHLGSARTGAHFATAPFIGAAAAIALGEPLTGLLIVALAMMAAATWLVLTEHHGHPHTHTRLEHAHRHRHDAHHRHDHRDGHDGTDVAEEEAHSHLHVHEPLTHSHPHLPDMHHRHRH